MLLLPLKTSIKPGIHLTPAFYTNHTVFANPQNTEQLLSISGTRFIISNDKLYVLGPVPPEEVVLRKYEGENNPFTLWDTFKTVDEAKTAIPVVNDQVTEIAINEHTIRVILIEKPIWEENSLTINSKRLSLYSPSRLALSPLLASAADIKKSTSWIDSINPFSGLFSKPSARLKPLEAPGLASDKNLQAFMKLLDDPKSVIILQEVNKILAEFEALLTTVPLNIEAKSESTPSEWSNIISNKYADILDSTHQFLLKLRFVRQQGDQYVLEIMDGLETYILGNFQSKIYSIFLMEEQLNDYYLSSRISLVGISDFGPSDVGIHSDVDAGLSKLVHLAGIQLIRFVRLKIVSKKIDALVRMHTIMADFETHRTKSLSSSDSDLLLGLTIYVVVRARPLNLIASLRLCQKIQRVSSIDGQSAYCLVNLAAAIQFIETMDLSIIQVPTDLLEMCLPPSPKSSKTITLPTDIVSKTSHAQSILASRYLPFQPGATLMGGISMVSDEMAKPFATPKPSSWSAEAKNRSLFSSTSFNEVRAQFATPKQEGGTSDVFQRRKLANTSQLAVKQEDK